MSDKTDPRLEVVARHVRSGPSSMASLVRFAADLDAADRAAGVVRVDTRDEALVERIAQAPDVAGEFGGTYDMTDVVRAVLTALREES